MACQLSNHLKGAESTSIVSVADWQQDETCNVLCAMCTPHMDRCLCCWWYVALFSTFPPVFLLSNVSINFQRKSESWRNTALCEEIEAWHYVTFSQSLHGLLVEQRDTLEPLAPGCLYSCCHQNAANLRAAAVARVLWWAGQFPRGLADMGAVCSPCEGVPQTCHIQSFLLTCLMLRLDGNPTSLPGLLMMGVWQQPDFLLFGPAQKSCVNFCPLQRVEDCQIPRKGHSSHADRQGFSPVQIALGDALFLLAAGQCHFCFCPCPHFLPVILAGRVQPAHLLP